MGKKNIILRALSYIMLNPVSPVITLIVGWLLSITVIAPDPQLPYPINYLASHKGEIVGVLIAWLALASMYQYYNEKTHDMKNQISNLNSTISIMENQIQQSAGIIMNKYGEFYQFKKQSIFNDLLQQFVSNTTNIDSAQIYSYSTCQSGQYVQIKISSAASYAGEGVDINQILQTYYPIEHQIYDQFIEIVHLWKKREAGLNDQVSPFEYEQLQNQLLCKIQDLFAQIHQELEQATRESILLNPTLFNHYRIMTLLYQISNPSDTMNITPQFLQDNHDLEEFLATGKRTGVLGAVLLQQTFIFRHAGASAKHGRIYICFPLAYNDEDFCVLCTLPPSENISIELCSYARKKFMKIFEKYN